MIKLGDILLIDEYLDEDKQIVNAHPFIVVNIENGVIEGYPYDLIGNFMSSIKSYEHRIAVLKYQSNLLINIDDGVKRESFIKAGIIYYFDSKNIKYRHLGNIGEEVYQKLIQLLQLLDEAEDLMININNISVM